MRTDTIVAVATAPGRAAVSIVRVSGADAERIVRQVVTPWPEVPRVMTRCRVHAPHAAGHAPIDDALVVHFPGPQSYTGETVVEVHGHGGTFVCQAIAGALLAAGARAASPGEFTERAVLNGKLDLVRAEAIEELIDARTRAAHRLAMQGVSGVRSNEFNALRESAIGLEALLAFDIDFPEEDQGALARERIDAAATELLERLAALTRTSRMASVARDGASVVLAGPPNAGKSSLMNALVGEARVIVSDEPGTTRDAVEVLLDGDRWPVRLVDTAGLRSDPGPVERLGIEVSERYLRGADVVLVCAESVDALDAMQDRLVALTGAILIPVSTKSDLTRATPGTSALSVSARTGEGIAELRIAIERAVSERFGSSDAETLVAGSARQAAALTVAHREISDFLIAWREGGLPAPVVATHLRAATTALDEIIGVVDIDDVFSRVFSTFCIGK